ncbi:MAG: hypothetical protein KZQ88_17510 [Candidatus Thiodiazotropha sp. (ex Dulcina madagascariensis)]|nr:hypothetical protein [Candidatus Thiodiazotropha sp. (ex Epidulcina cf. delphinae)]MCU7924490.1 hypothetical protein [Candidatus Thiodiazotropha sp. (ex Dulcina madagascariensis)]MCU7928155.1 hypothetical protein [Candidatus Thiodiazotropha sp. (ex Dulcina madagascariensis)]
MASKELESLELRIGKIEHLLEEAVAKRAPANISAEEIAAYRKVKDIVAADWGDFCGINDCYRCVIVRCLQCYTATPQYRACDVECSCGPCNIGQFGGSMRRFQELG